jgi:hypothetical protein
VCLSLPLRSPLLWAPFQTLLEAHHVADEDRVDVDTVGPGTSLRWYMLAVACLVAMQQGMQ